VMQISSSSGIVPLFRALLIIEILVMYPWGSLLGAHSCTQLFPSDFEGRLCCTSKHVSRNFKCVVAV
jgi:hypothetical protein